MITYPNKWGNQGWTYVELNKVQKALFIDAVTTAYAHITFKKSSKNLSNAI